MSNTNSIQICPGSVTMREGSWFSDVSVCGCECGECCDVIWHSEDTSVATVNESNGQIYGKGPGNTRIYASSKDGSVIYGYIDVVVEREYVTNIVIGQIPEFYSGTSQYVGYYVEPAYATCPSVTWSFSPEGVVEKRKDVLVALKAGTTTMTIAATDGSGVTATAVITVKQGTKVESITVAPETVVLALNETIKLKANVLPETASDIGVHWVSENTRIAMVDQQTGVVTPLRPGIVDVVAHSADESTVSGRCHVYVKATKDYPDFDESEGINIESGAHKLSKDLLALFGGQGLKLTIEYNSLKICTSIFGARWYHNFDKHVEVVGNEIILYETPNDMYLFVEDVECGCGYVCEKNSKIGYKFTVEYNGEYPLVLNCNYNRTEYYDFHGRLAKITDHNGFETLMTYSENGITITDSVTSKKIHLLENAAGYIGVVHDGATPDEYSNARAVVLNYDANGNIISITDANGATIQFEYDANNQMFKEINALGVAVYENSYDECGRLVKQTDAMNDEARFTEYSYSAPENDPCNYLYVTDRCGKTSVYEMHDKGALKSYTNPNNEKTEYVYDSNFNLIEERDELGTIVKIYDSKNRVTSVTDKLGHITTIEYNDKNDVTKIKHPQLSNDDHGETFDYNERNQIKEHIDLRGTKTYYMYYKPEDQEEITSGGYHSKQFDDAHVGLLYRKLTYDASGDVSRVEEYTYTNGLLTEVEDARGNKTEYTYYSNGLVKTKKDAQGNVTQYTYDNVGNVLTVTDALGNVVTYSYDANNRLIEKTDAKGNKASYAYDNNGLNTCVRLPDGSEVKYEYDNEGRKIKEIDQAGEKIEYIYDAGGRLVTKLLPNEGEFKYVYSKSNGKTVVKEITPLGAETVNTYDAANNLVQQKDHENNVTTYEYNSLNKVVKVTDPVGNVTSCVYSAAGDLLQETDADGNVTVYTYDEYGNLKTKKNPRGNITTYTYDANNNLVSKSDIVSNITMCTTYTYDSLNRLSSKTDARGNTETYGYDALGRRVSVTDAQGNTFRTYYDANGNVIRTEDAYGDTMSETQYNSLNQPISITDAKGTRTFTYTATGKTATVTDAAGNTQTYTYDEVGNNTLVKDVLGNNSTSVYDKLGNITILTGPNSAQTNYVYDEMGRLLSKSIDSNCAITYTYNTLNQKSSVTNGRGQTSTFEYTPAGRPKVFNTPCGEVEFTYDANGNIHTAEDNNGTVTRVYDKLNRLKQYTDTYGKTVFYDYDEVGNITKITYPDLTEVTYTYDANNNITSVTDWAGRVTQYTYDNNNNLIGVTHANGCTTTHTYDNKQRLTRTVEKTENDTIITSFEYYYDEMGRIIKEKDLEKSVEVCYTYDKLSRVKRREIEGLIDESWDLEKFFYDAAGNITTSNSDRSGSYSTTNYTYDSLTNRLASYDGCTPTYDADGNMLTAQLDGLTCNMTYDYMNRLASAKNNMYTYNAENMRIRNVCDMHDTKYTYDPNGKLSKLIMKNTNDSVKKYVYGIGLIGEDDNGHFKTYHFDYRGSTVAITNESGAITDRFAYDTYGKQISHTGNSFIIFGYNGRDGVITDVNGLLYMRSRYYSPELRRFVNADVLHGNISNSPSLNRYAYVNGNPVSFVDPFGLFGIDLFQSADVATYGFEFIKRAAEVFKKQAVALVSPINNWVQSNETISKINDFVGTAIDISITVTTALTALAIGHSVAKLTQFSFGIGNPIGTVAGLALGLASAMAVFGSTNNAINAFYYNHLSDGVPSIVEPPLSTPNTKQDAQSEGENETQNATGDESDLKSYYVDNGYINRWKRLDYTKSIMKSSGLNSDCYTPDAWRYYSEYNLHMWGWTFLEWAHEKDYGKFSEYAQRSEHAHVKPGVIDDDPTVKIFTYLVGLLGL